MSRDYCQRHGAGSTETLDGTGWLYRHHNVHTVLSIPIIKPTFPPSLVTNLIDYTLPLFFAFSCESKHSNVHSRPDASFPSTVDNILVPHFKSRCCTNNAIDQSVFCTMHLYKFCPFTPKYFTHNIYYYAQSNGYLFYYCNHCMIISCFSAYHSASNPTKQHIVWHVDY